MLSFNVSFEEKPSPEYEKLKETLRKSHGSYVTIGIHSDAGKYSGSDAPEVFEVALWNEFGTHNIPERSFLRSSIDGHIEEINRWRDEALGNMIYRGWDLEKALNMIGFRIQVLIQNKIKSNVPPPNAPSTQANKGREGFPQRTLIETGLMLRSVKYKLVLR